MKTLANLSLNIPKIMCNPENECYLHRAIFHTFFVLTLFIIGFNELNAKSTSYVDSSRSSSFNVIDSDSTKIREDLIEVFGPYFSSNQFEIATVSQPNGAGHLEFQANGVLLGSQCQISGVVNETGRPEYVAVDLSENTAINVRSLNELIGTGILDVLPIPAKIAIGDNLKFSHLKFNLNEELKPKEVIIDFVLGDWELTGYQSMALKSVKVSLSSKNPTSVQSISFGGSVQGVLEINGEEIRTTAQISNELSDLSFDIFIKEIQTSQLKSWLSTTGLTNQVQTIAPVFFDNVNLKDVEVQIVPFAKSASAKATSEIGDFYVDMTASGGTDIQMGVTSSGKISLGSIDASLSALDDFDFQNMTVILSSKAGPNRLPFDQNQVSDELGRGINIHGTIALEGKAKDLLKLEEVDVSGTFRSSGSFSMFARAEFANAEISSGVRFSEVRFGIEVAESRPSMILGGLLEVDISDSESLGLNGEFKLNSAGVEGVGAFWLEAIKRQGSVISEGDRFHPAEWKDPFGIKGVTIRKLGVSIGVSPTSPVLISSMGFAGDMSLGTNSDEVKHIRGDLALNVKATDPSGSLIDLNVAHMNLKGFIEAFSNVELDGVIADVTRSIGTDSTKIKIVPRDGISFLGETYDKGVQLENYFNLLGQNAEMSFKVNPADGKIEGKGSMDPVTIKAGDFELLHLSGNVDQNGDDRPRLELDVSTNPKLVIDAELRVLEAMTLDGECHLEAEGFKAHVSGSLGGVIDGEATIIARDFNQGGVRIKGKLEDKIIESLEDLSSNLVQDATRTAQDSYTQLQEELNSSNPIDVIEGVFNASLSTLEALPKGLAAGGAYIASKGIGNVINIDSLTFDFQLESEMTQIQLGIHGEIVGRAFSTTAVMTLEFGSLEEILANIAEVIGEEILASLESLGQFILEDILLEALNFAIEVGEAIVEVVEAGIEWLENTFNCEVVRAPSNTGPMSAAAGIYHYAVTVNDFTVDASSDQGFDDEIEIYGSIYLKAQGKLSYVHPWSNQFFFNRSCNDQIRKDESEVYPINGTKHIYFTESEVKNGSITVVGDLYESDAPGHFENDEIYGSHGVYLKDVGTNGEIKKFKVYCGSGDLRISISFEVRGEIVEHNIARNNASSQISDASYKTMSIKAIDGGTDGRLSSEQVSVTAKEINPWWQVDLGLTHSIDKLKIWKSIDETDAYDHLWVLWGDDETFGDTSSPSSAIGQKKKISFGDNSYISIDLESNMDGRFIRVWSESNSKLAIAEVIVDGTISVAKFKEAIATNNWSDFWLYQQHMTPEIRTEVLLDVVRTNNEQWVMDLLRGGARPNTTHLEVAIKKTRSSYSPGTQRNWTLGSKRITTLLLSHGARLNDDLFELLMLYDDRENAVYAIERGYVPGSLMLERSLDDFNYSKVAMAMIDHGVPITDEALIKAVEKNQLIAITMVKEQGIVPSDIAFNRAIDLRKSEIVIAFCERKIASDDNLTTAAMRNETKIYQAMVAGGARVSSGGSLTEAIKNKNSEIFNLALSFGAKPNQGVKPACDLGFSGEKFLVQLLEQGANPDSVLNYASKKIPQPNDLFHNLVSEYGANPNLALLAAGRSGHKEFLAISLEYGGNPNLVIEDQAEKKLFDNVKLLVAYGADPDAAMLWAIAANNSQITQFLIDHGANTTDEEYMRSAIQRSDETIVVQLLNHGASADLACSYAVTFKLKENSPRRRIIHTSLNYGANPQGLMSYPSRSGDIDILRAFLTHGASPDEGLPFACSENQSKAVLLLLEYGADPELGIRETVIEGNSEIAQYLIDSGANTNKDEYVIIAAKNCHGELMRLLLEYGANPNSVEKGEYALILTADVKKNSLTTVQALIDFGADTSVRDDKGNTSLHLAAANGKKSLEVVKLLLSLGLDTFAINNKDKDVLDVAKGAKMKKLIKEHRTN